MPKNALKGILFLSGIFPPDIGGPATYCSFMAREAYRRGYPVRVVAYGNASLDDAYPFPVARIARIFLPVRLAIFTAYAAWHGIHCPVWYAHGGLSSTLPALIIGKVLGRRIGIKITGDYVWEQARNRGIYAGSIDAFQNERNLPIFVRAAAYIRALVVRNADFVVVPSEYLAGIVRGWGVSDAALCVVHNAIELPSTYSHNRTFDTPLFTLMTASRLVPWKYVEGLIALLPRLFDLHCECRLLIAGDGPERARLEAFASSLSVASSVVFLGAIPRTRVLELVSISDIFLLNSDYEGFSHVLLEAMSLGSVIVARASGGNKELITNGCNGYLMDSAAPHAAWADLIRDLLRDSTRRARISCAARARSEQFTFKRMADETLAHI